MFLIMSQWAKKVKKVQSKNLVKSNKSKNLFCEIASLAVLNFFPSSKFDFWPFLKRQKMEFCKKKTREIDLFDCTSFLPYCVIINIFF